ncbi:hypothetical protein EPN15_01270 [Patescibacteria group bacterium]|nr:MAG: hypothetical protein EPN15_01270 [Patescibacteria group bacterium]
MWNPKNLFTSPPGGPSEKMIAVIIAFLGISAIVLGTLQIQKGIKGPFQKNIAREKDKRNDLDLEQVDKLTELQKKDTDKDGLNDYVELYNSRTSPYLRDSDSDGIDDKTEIDQGADPNCPKGQDCGLPVAAPANLNIGNINESANFTNAPGLNQASDALSGNLPPAELRKILISSGAPENVINGLNDDELIKLYKEVLQGQPPAGTNSPAANNPSTNVSVDISKITPADLEKLSSSEIRSLMSQFGIAKETLDQVDDATLKTIFIQAIQEQTP